MAVIPDAIELLIVPTYESEIDHIQIEAVPVNARIVPWYHEERERWDRKGTLD